MKRSVVILGIVLLALVALWRPVETQGPAVMFLSGASGSTPANAVSLAAFPVSTTTTARNTGGALMAEKSSRWTVVSAPAVSTLASASLAAEASVRHVADCVIFSGGSTTAPALTNLTINLRDGATGAGTVIASWNVTVSNTTGQNVAPFSACGLNLVGTTNTAMTLEYSSLLLNLFESVTLTGYNVI
jgi:hypothetical protein